MRLSAFPDRRPTPQAALEWRVPFGASWLTEPVRLAYEHQRYVDLDHVLAHRIRLYGPRHDIRCSLQLLRSKAKGNRQAADNRTTSSRVRGDAF